MNLHSSASKVGKAVTQIIIFTSGLTKTYHGIISSTIEEGKFVKMWDKQGKMIMVNSSNVAIVEVFNEEVI